MSQKEDNSKLILGLKIHQLRESKNLLLKDISNASGLSISYINEIEKGKKYPKPEKIALLANALGVTFDELSSLTLRHELSPLEKIINSNLLNDLPLNLFGVDKSYLSELMSNSPMQFNAFVNTLIEIARNYDLRVEQFFFSALRSYQEMHNNYFQEIEDAVQEFSKLYSVKFPSELSYEKLKKIAIEKFGYTIIEDELEKYPELHHLRSLYISEPNRTLLLNKDMHSSQKAFTIGKELGYHVLQLTERANTSTWIKVESFNQVLNNFKMAYFSASLLLPKEKMILDIKKLFAQKTWNPDLLLQQMTKYNATAEMFLHRLTTLLPQYFDIHEMYFLRFSTKRESEHYDLTKELHISRLHNPHANALNEHYCRRWVAITTLKKLHKQAKLSTSLKPIVETQRSLYHNTPHSYINLSVARTSLVGSDNLSCVTLGIHIDDQTKQKIKFINDDSIETRVVNETCERCEIENCQDRVAEPSIIHKQIVREKQELVLEQIKSKFS